MKTQGFPVRALYTDQGGCGTTRGAVIEDTKDLREVREYPTEEAFQEAVRRVKIDHPGRAFPQLSRIDPECPPF